MSDDAYFTTHLPPNKSAT